MQITEEEDHAIQMAEQTHNNEQAKRAYAEIEEEQSMCTVVAGTEDF